MIIGITGYARSGKDTVGSELVSLSAGKQGFLRYAFADPLKLGIKIMYDFTNDQLWGGSKDIVDVRYGITPRQILQYYGTEVAQFIVPQHFPEIGKLIGRNHWAKRFEYEYKKTKINYVITDVRFPHEVETIKKLGGIMLRVDRDAVKPSGDLHESEALIDSLEVDHIIKNNSTKDSLYAKIESLYAHMTWSRA